MPAYKVRVTGTDGQFIVGATLNCMDDAAAVSRFESLPLPAGRAELALGARVVSRREIAAAERAVTRQA